MIYMTPKALSESLESLLGRFEAFVTWKLLKILFTSALGKAKIDYLC